MVQRRMCVASCPKIWILRDTINDSARNNGVAPVRIEGWSTDAHGRHGVGSWRRESILKKIDHGGRHHGQSSQVSSPSKHNEMCPGLLAPSCAWQTVCLSSALAAVLSGDQQRCRTSGLAGLESWLQDSSSGIPATASAGRCI